MSTIGLDREIITEKPARELEPLVGICHHKAQLAVGTSHRKRLASLLK